MFTKPSWFTWHMQSFRFSYLQKCIFTLRRTHIYIQTRVTFNMSVWSSLRLIPITLFHTHMLPWQQVCGRCRIVTAGTHNCSINFLWRMCYILHSDLLFSLLYVDVSQYVSTLGAIYRYGKTQYRCSSKLLSSLSTWLNWTSAIPFTPCGPNSDPPYLIIFILPLGLSGSGSSGKSKSLCR